MDLITFQGENIREITDHLDTIQDISKNLGIIFTSPFLGITELSRSLARYPFPIIGCTTAGEIYTIDNQFPLYEFSAVGAILSINPDFFRTELFQRNDEEPFQLGVKIGKWGREVFQNPDFMMLVSGLIMNSEAIIRGIEHECSHAVRIFGGVAGDDGNFNESWTFLNGRKTKDGVVVLAFDSSQIRLTGVTTGGWTAVGTPMTVTSSKANVVMEINRIPALDVYQQYLNLTDAEIPRFSIDFPLILHRENGSDIIRSVLMTDPVARSLTFAGSIPEGSLVSFSSSPGPETITRSVKEINDKRDLIEDSDVAILFSCMARYSALGDDVKEEILAAWRLRHKPIIGYLSYGEISPNYPGSCELHNEAYNLMLLSERRS